MHNLLRTEDHGDFEHNFPHDRRLNRPHWRKARRSSVSGVPKSKLQSVLEAGSSREQTVGLAAFSKFLPQELWGKSEWQATTLTERTYPVEGQQWQETIVSLLIVLPPPPFDDTSLGVSPPHTEHPVPSEPTLEITFLSPIKRCQFNPSPLSVWAVSSLGCSV